MGVGINLLYVRELYNRQSIIDTYHWYLELFVNKFRQTLSVVSKIVTFFTIEPCAKFAGMVLITC